MHNVQVYNSIKLLAAKDVLGASSSDVHDLNVDVSGHMLHGASVNAQQLCGSVEPTRDCAAKVACDACDQDSWCMFFS